MTGVLERLKGYRRRKHPEGLANNLRARLNDSETAALLFIVTETGADQSAVTRLALNRLIGDVLGELGIPLSRFGLPEG